MPPTLRTAVCLDPIELLERARAHARAHSHDPDTQTGCIAITADGRLLEAANRLADGVVAAPERLSRPAKYAWITHAERVLVYRAAREGISLLGATMYLPWHPCAACAQAIAGAGFSKLVCHAPNLDDPRWGGEFRIALEILAESGVETEHVAAPKIMSGARVSVPG
jgi:dCMP deaminase